MVEALGMADPDLVSDSCCMGRTTVPGKLLPLLNALKVGNDSV